MIWDRRKKNGYSDFGPIQIPPYPQIVVLIDRADSSQWVVSFETNPIERISIVDLATFAAVQKREGARIYKGNHGPGIQQVDKLDFGWFTLFVRSGRLGVDFENAPQMGIQTESAPIYALQLDRSQQRLVNLNGDDPATIHLGYIAP